MASAHQNHGPAVRHTRRAGVARVTAMLAPEGSIKPRGLAAPADRRVAERGMVALGSVDRSDPGQAGRMDCHGSDGSRGHGPDPGIARFGAGEGRLTWDVTSRGPAADRGDLENGVGRQDANAELGLIAPRDPDRAPANAAEDDRAVDSARASRAAPFGPRGRAWLPVGCAPEMPPEGGQPLPMVKVTYTGNQRRSTITC